MAGFALRSRFAGHPSHNAKTRNALRLKPDHPIGAGHIGALTKQGSPCSNRVLLEWICGFGNLRNYTNPVTNLWIPTYDSSVVCKTAAIFLIVQITALFPIVE